MAEFQNDILEFIDTFRNDEYIAILLHNDNNGHEEGICWVNVSVNSSERRLYVTVNSNKQFRIS